MSPSNQQQGTDREEHEGLLNSFTTASETPTNIPSESSNHTSELSNATSHESSRNSTVSESDDDHLFMDSRATGFASELGESSSSSAALRQEPGDLENQGPHQTGKLSAKQRLINVIYHFFPIKQTYERINNGITTGRMQANIPGNFIGQGTDGVFRNLMAKPDTDAERQGQETHPPTYEEAAADSSPEYWESTVISPMYEDEVFVEGLPVGNVANFIWNGLVSVAFQFVGFVLCYLLHTSHAAKQGSRAGLGITFIMYGWSMIPSNFGHADQLPLKYMPDDANMIGINQSYNIKKGSTIDTYQSSLYSPTLDGENYDNNTPYFAYGVIAFGIFMILNAFAGYYRVKRIEQNILAPSSADPLNTTSTTSTTEVRNSTEQPPAPIFQVGNA